MRLVSIQKQAHIRFIKFDFKNVRFELLFDMRRWIFLKLQLTFKSKKNKGDLIFMSLKLSPFQDL